MDIPWIFRPGPNIGLPLFTSCDDTYLSGLDVTSVHSDCFQAFYAADDVCLHSNASVSLQFLEHLPYIKVLPLNLRILIVAVFEKLEKSTASASCKIVLVYGPALNSPGDLRSKSTGYKHQRNSYVSFGDKTSSLHIKLGVILHISKKRTGESMYGTV